MISERTSRWLSEADATDTTRVRGYVPTHNGEKCGSPLPFIRYLPMQFEDLSIQPLLCLLGGPGVRNDSLLSFAWWNVMIASRVSLRFVVSLLTPGKESCLFPITGVSYEIRKSRIFLQVSVRWKASSFVAFYWYLVFYDFVNKSDGGEKTESKRFLGRFSETDIEFFGTCEYPFPLLFGSNFLKNQTLSAKDEFYVFFT